MRCTRPSAWASAAGLSKGSARKTCVASVRFRPLLPLLTGSSSTRTSTCVLKAPSARAEPARLPTSEANLTLFFLSALPMMSSTTSHCEKTIILPPGVRPLAPSSAISLRCSQRMRLTMASTLVPQLPATSTSATCLARAISSSVKPVSRRLSSLWSITKATSSMFMRKRQVGQRIVMHWRLRAIRSVIQSQQYSWPHASTPTLSRRSRSVQMLHSSSSSSCSSASTAFASSASTMTTSSSSSRSAAPAAALLGTRRFLRLCRYLSWPRCFSRSAKKRVRSEACRCRRSGSWWRRTL
mmetsp:Transcript_12881/g.51430  ORF Transcript_12881/g.51430 Transcript_12881/m.51430 type:complete len:297 (-) Transcript_12881:3479-4369(-)